MIPVRLSNLIVVLALALSTLALSAAPALAEPELQLELTNEPTTLPRSDERMVYEATISNVAGTLPQPGDSLTCLGTPEDEKLWIAKPAPTFAYQWVRNGSEIPGATNRTYVTEEEDAGKSLQCVVTATNRPVDGDGNPLPGYGLGAPISASATSLPPTVVAPAPVPAPPSGTKPANMDVLPFTEGTEVGCAPPNGWTGTGVTWTYQWLRNGEPLPGETGSKHLITNEDVSPPSVIQCQATAKDSFGAEAIAISETRRTQPPPEELFAPYIAPSNTGEHIPTVGFNNTTSGTVTLSMVLPEGSETLVTGMSGTGWSCSITPPADAINSSVNCSRSNSLAPGDSYPPLKIVTALGADAPEPSGVATATVSGGGALESATDSATYTFTAGIPFGILAGSFEAGVYDEAGEIYSQAGGHPFRGYTTFGFNVHRNGGDDVVPTGRPRDVVVELPRGFGGNATATPELCESIDDVVNSTCPPQSVVGGVEAFTSNGWGQPFNIYPNGPVGDIFKNLPIYAMEPEFGQPAQFAFAISATGTPYSFVPELRAEDGYAINFRTAPLVTSPPLWGTKVHLCDYGAKLKEGKANGEGLKFDGCLEAEDADSYPQPLITNPTRCSGPAPVVTLDVNSWEHPDRHVSADYQVPPIEGCDRVDFEPEAAIEPTSNQADSPTGLEVSLQMPTDGLLSKTGIAQANLHTAKVVFPAGMSLNPAAASGLGACTPAQIGLGTNDPATCPESSRVGTVEIETPILANPLNGSVYLAAQKDNPFDTTAGLYMVFSSKRDGIVVKVAGKVVPDPVTGQLTATFSESPEAPFSRVTMKLAEGPRAPLITPPKCGNYTITSSFSPWTASDPASPSASEIVTDETRFRVSRGPGGGPCPEGRLEPKLSAGVADEQAGSSSPFGLVLSREDGTQRFTATQVTLPDGLLARLAGVPYCPEAALTSISDQELTGAAQRANPSCPAASQLGTLSAFAGAGPQPLRVDTGRVYLAGPYKGGPISLALVVPALAGPLDLGSVLTRVAVRIDPATAQVTVVSDPIPTALHGFALDLREVRVSVDRPGFIQAPSGCESKQVSATVSGDLGGLATVASPFQMGGCEKLGFKPAVKVRLFGAARRGAYQGVRAEIRPRPGDSNIDRTVIRFPRSAFIAQEHIRTVCTRVQWAQDACPEASVYGSAMARSPLLDYPLEGKVYLRSSDNVLPDVVADLRGPAHQPVRIEVAVETDSVKQALRNTVRSAPDAPVSYFRLQLAGGKKGLIVNSRNICFKPDRNRLRISMTAQNGRPLVTTPVLRGSSCSKRGGKKGRSVQRPSG